jgi:hypothetical protein
MEKKTQQIRRIEKALAQAHREQTAPDLPPEWREGVMRHIRRIQVKAHEAGTSPSTTLVFQRMILPLATATGLVAVALLAYLLTTSPGMEQDLFAMLTQDPSGLLATEALGLQR